MDIYIKPTKKASLSGTEHDSVYIKDIAEVFAPPELSSRVKNVKLLKLGADKKKSYLISVIDMIKAIDNALPGHTINNVGEIDTLIEYKPKKSKDNSLWKWAKIFFVTVVIFAGASSSIMSFHTDAQLGDVFKNFNYIFFNEKVENPLILEIPYSIGLTVGIIVFFNHFAGRKLTNDPTPIEVVMKTYDAEVSNTMIDILSTEKTKAEGKEKENNKQ